MKKTEIVKDYDIGWFKYEMDSWYGSERWRLGEQLLWKVWSLTTIELGEWTREWIGERRLTYVEFMRGHVKCYHCFNGLHKMVMGGIDQVNIADIFANGFCVGCGNSKFRIINPHRLTHFTL